MAKFYFSPLKKKSKEQEGGLAVTISRAGQLMLSKWVLLNLGIENEPFYIYLYEDPPRKALAFKIEKLNGEIKTKLHSNVRCIKPIVIKGKYHHAVVGIRSFLKNFKDVELPQKSLPLKKYDDSSLGAGELYYFQIQEKNENNKGI